MPFDEYHGYACPKCKKKKCVIITNILDDHWIIHCEKCKLKVAVHVSELMPLSIHDSPVEFMINKFEEAANG